MKEIFCDVCEEPISSPICEYCNFNNHYQFFVDEQYSNDEIIEFIEDNIYFSEEILIKSIMDRYNLTLEEARLFFP